jgi:hypothetical protein
MTYSSDFDPASFKYLSDRDLNLEFQASTILLHWNEKAILLVASHATG